MYFWALFCEVALLCYWGNEVTLESSKVAQTAFHVPFAGTSVQFQKALIMMIIRGQREVKLTAGGFVELSLTTLMKVRH